LIARPKSLEPNRFILRFPVKNDVLGQDTSRRIKVLVSPNYIRFKPSRSGNRPRYQTRHCIGCKIHRQVSAGALDFCQVSKSRNGRRIFEIQIAFYFNILIESCERIITVAAPSEGDTNLAAIPSAFGRLNHPKPRALNRPTCGNHYAALGLRAPQWCAKRRSN
jgi:hypothetical protein